MQYSFFYLSPNRFILPGTYLVLNGYNYHEKPFYKKRRSFKLFVPDRGKVERKHLLATTNHEEKGSTYVQDCTQLRNLQILRFFAIFAGQRFFGSVLRNLRIFTLLCDAN